MQATPFLLPLMFQLAFGMSAVQAGLFTLAYFLGNLMMKTVTTPVLRRWGSRRVMRVGCLLAAASLLGCALLQPDTPLVLTVALLVTSGALTLALSQMGHGRSALAAVDFRVAFGVMAALGLIGVAGSGRLKPGDGAEVSGHTTRDRPYNWLVALVLIE